MIDTLTIPDMRTLATSNNNFEWGIVMTSVLILKIQEGFSGSELVCNVGTSFLKHD